MLKFHFLSNALMNSIKEHIKIWTPFMAVVVSLLTLWHLSRVYRVSNEPQLKFNDTEITIHAERLPYGTGFGYLTAYIHNGIPDTSILIRNKSSNKTTIKLSWNTSDLNKFDLQIVNIGLRAASDIHFKWSIDTLEWITLFNKYVGSFQFQSFLLSDYELHIYELNDTTFYLDKHYTEHIHYLLPESESQNDTYIHIPLNYIRLLCYLKYYSQSNHDFIFESPPLSLEVEFLDPRQKSKKVKFDFYIELSKDKIGALDNFRLLYYPAILIVKQVK